jgi:hypothetical protein
MTGDSRDPRITVVPSRGFRLPPWGFRIGIAIVAAFVAAACYGFFGWPVGLAPLTGWAFSFSPIVVAWIFLEMISIKSVEISEQGVRFTYPFSRRDVPWSQLELSRTQTIIRYNDVRILELGRAAKPIRAHHVTVEEAQAIVRAMPDPPTGPLAAAVLAQTRRTRGAT